jgi:hypothetical protein
LSDLIVGGLQFPDLKPHFKHMHWRPMPHSMGVPVGSDWTDYPEGHEIFGLYKNCGVWTDQEAAILYHCVKQVGGLWLDVGAHTGWTTMHQLEAGARVIAVDNMFAVPEFFDRFRQNMANYAVGRESLTLSWFPFTSNDFFEKFPQEWPDKRFDGVVIDGDHDHPCPLLDAQNALGLLEPHGVILMHDFAGSPVHRAASWLMDQGMRCRVYFTPHMVGVLYFEGKFTPPEHRRDQNINWNAVKRTMAGFPFERTDRQGD